MTRFTAPRVSFGRRPQAADAVPSPIVARAAARRTAQLAEAADVLAVLPAEGESLHAVMTGRYDFMHLIAVLVDRIGIIEKCRIATLSYNRRNLAEMLALIDAGKVKTLTLLCSAFFRDHNKGLWEETLTEFRERGQRAAAARSHCKIVTLAAAGSARWTMEGSANLRTNSNREQFALFRDAGLHDWHATWIDELVTRHEGDEAEPVIGGTAKTSRIGHHFRHSGLGVWCARRGLGDKQQDFDAWKRHPAAHEAFTASMAADLCAVIRQWQPAIPKDAVVTTPPPGASAGKPYPAGFLGQAVARLLDRDYQTTLAPQAPSAGTAGITPSRRTVSG